MGPRPVWTRSRVVIVALAVSTLLYAIFLGTLYLRLPGDGYGVHLSAQGFTIDRAGAGGELQRNDTVVYIGPTGTGEPRFGNDLLRPGVWHRRILGPTTPSQATRTYTLLRDGERRSFEVTLRRANLGALFSRTGILFFLGLVFVLNSLYIVLRRSDDPVGRLMASALLAEGLNLVNNTINLFSINLSVSYFWLFVPIDILSFWAAFSLLLHTALAFPQAPAWLRRRPRTLWALYALNPLIGGAGALLIGDGSALATRAAIYQIGYPIAALQLFAALGWMAHVYRTTDRPLVRPQIRWILWGITIGVAGWLVLFAIPIVVTGNPLTDLSLALIPLVAIPVTFTFAVTRYRLLDIDRIINRSLVYGALSLFLVAVYLAAVALISRGLQLLTGREEDATVIFLSTLSVALTFALVRDRFQRLIDRAFYPNKINFQQLLHEVGRELSTTLVFDELVRLLTKTVPRRLDVEGAVLYVLDEEGDAYLPHGTSRWASPLPRTPTLEAHLKAERVLVAGQGEDEATSSCFDHAPGLQLCLSLTSRGRLIGLYGFGPKTSGDPYNGEEIQILLTHSHQVAIALENTRLYHQVESYNRSLEALVRQRTQELEQAHETVATERNKLDAVLNTITDALVATDAHGHILLTNPVFDALVGRPTTRLVGHSLSEAIADENLQTMVVQALADSTRVFSGDLTLGSRTYRASARALRATVRNPQLENPAVGNEISGVVTVLRDVTHEVAVDRMKTDFISIVSHELRTPLTSVLGFAKLIHRTFDRHIAPALGKASGADASPPARQKLDRAVARIYENLEIIESESQRLTRLINDVLDIAKMEAGKIEWREENVDPVEVIESAVASASALAREKNLPIVVEYPASTTSQAKAPALPNLWSDFDRLVQVMTNLLSNAIKFTDEGQITVRCSVVGEEQLNSLRGDGPASPDPEERDARPPATDDTNPTLLISVSDTGIGIAPENLSTLFEKFRQVGDTLTDRPKGSGLGLSICKEIVEHHGGTIWAESELGVGSTFMVTLPLLPETSIPSLDKPLSTLGNLDTRWVRRRVSEYVPAVGDSAPLILVVDDEPNIRRLLNEELSDVGYRVIEAADGVQALARARRHRPDLIILDVMMPGVSGFDVTSALKADEQTADIPILILSIIEDRQRGLRLGADEYLTKPVDITHLLRTIASLLREIEIDIEIEPTAPETKERRRKVLVVDEDASVVEAITRALRARGFEVVEAYDPRGAIQRVEAERPDLVILDAMLSKLNDYALLKALRYQDREQRMNIIVLSGQAPPQKKKKARG